MQRHVHRLQLGLNSTSVSLVRLVSLITVSSILVPSATRFKMSFDHVTGGYVDENE